MAYAIKRKLYDSLPTWIRRCVCLVPFPLLAGKAYRDVIRRGSRIDFISRSEILAYQERLLGETLQFVVEQVPAYQDLREAVQHMPPFDALRDFPLLDKETLQQNMADYLPHDFERIPHCAITTGGTSGNQLKFYVDADSQSVETAFGHRMWARVGYTWRKRLATFRGVQFPNLKPGTYWQQNPLSNELQFSPFHMSEDTLDAYIEKLRQYRPHYLFGYPSAIDVLAEFVLRHELSDALPDITAAFLISEGILPAQRQRIEAAFRTRVFSSYGHSERVVMGAECEKGDSYHQFPDYGYLEIVDEVGNACEPGQRGEIVGTGFLNRSLPFIRYRTGDHATLLDPACDCGRHWDRFAQVEGRWKQDVLIGKNGAKISIAALNMHGRLFDNVVRYRYVQNEAGRFDLQVMPSPAFEDTDREMIERAYRDKIGEELDLSLELVENIPLTEGGKLKLLESTLNGTAG